MALPWYQDGLNFSCTGCGKCCTGAPGYVWISDEEAERLAALLKISLREFLIKYTRRAQGRLSLIESRVNGDCVFLEGKRCRVYEARPKQCRTFPFWPRHLASKEAWEAAAQECEGISPEAPLVFLNAIEENLKE